MHLHLLALSLLSLVAASHVPRRRHHSRHHVPAPNGSLVQRDDACTYGAWRCDGLALQRCFADSWNTMRVCTSDMACSVDPDKTGCIWPWQVDGLSDGESTVSAVPTVVAAQGVTASPSPSPSSATTTAATTSQQPEQSSTLVPTNPWTTVIPTASATAIGNAFFHWQDASSSVSGSFSLESSSSVIATATSTTSVSDASPSSWTNTWWTPSSAQSTGSTTTSTATRRRKSSSQAVASASATTTTTTDPWATSALVPLPTAIPTTPSNGLSSPHYVIYSDAWLTTMPTLASIAGYNRFLLAFWLSTSGPVDNALFWSSLSAAERAVVKAEYGGAGVALMVSAFGSTDTPTTAGVDPTACALRLAAFVKANDLDGVDIDYEDNQAFNNGVAEAWLITFQTVLRQQLPAPYVISHAPQAPWFTSTGQYTGGGYTKVHEAVGDGIDFYNIQFYNQGQIYLDCPSLLFTSGGSFPSTSVFEIHTHSNVPLSKIVIGKPLDEAGAANGYMSSATLGECVKQAKAKGWDGGVMYWEWQVEVASLVMLAVLG